MVIGKILILLHVAVCGFLLLANAAQASPRSEVIRGPLPGKVLEVLDGDTFAVRLHIWIGQQIEISVRIAGIDTPEIRGKCTRERALASAARAELQRLLGDGAVVLSDIRLEKYAGRVLARATTQNGVSIADHLIGKGLARPYTGNKRQGWCN